MWVWWRWKFPDGATLSTFPLYCLSSPIPRLKWRTSQLRHFEICLIICLYLYHMSYLFVVWNEECPRYWSFLQYHLVFWNGTRSVFSSSTIRGWKRISFNVDHLLCLWIFFGLVFALPFLFSFCSPSISLSSIKYLCFFRLYPLPAVNIMI